MAKCLVCGHENSLDVSACSNCGFPELKKEFLNHDELKHWVEETIAPCKSVYSAMVKQQSLLQQKFSELSMKYYADKASAADKYNSLRSLVDQKYTCGSIRKNGWNANALIAHPLIFVAKTTSAICEVFDIIFEVEYQGIEDGLDRIGIKFNAKKLRDDNEFYSGEIGFKYEVKDALGSIVDQGSWIEFGLDVDDVVSGGFVFNTFIPSGCHIEFSDYLL